MDEQIAFHIPLNFNFDPISVSGCFIAYDDFGMTVRDNACPADRREVVGKAQQAAAGRR
ncbi:hypothetical protein JNB91_14240 [Rhizobium wenxiniae]|uniref:hypothetical protein n=1 Tax=Rhizobium wenxiniae TaxID=1737357 RepID=UPI001C6E4204|nr:hypothetical protein [Rhizobium wenxiniae]MBW9089008.1 hypothetical protein [Rhizobium wenxiniae]